MPSSPNPYASTTHKFTSLSQVCVLTNLNAGTVADIRKSSKRILCRLSAELGNRL